MSMLRMALMGTGAAGAAGVAILGGPYLDGKRTSPAPASARSDICLKNDLPMFEGVRAKCYSRDDLRALSEAPLVDRQGAQVSMSMTHPTDASVTPADCKTCSDYRKMSFEGRYAATSRDMRREGYFIRACGVLDALSNAQPAQTSFFENGSPTSEEVTALAASMKFGETGPANIQVEKGAGQVWRITAGSFNVQFHEIANADFDNDGVEEILAFSASAPEAGTASFYDIGLMEIDSASAPLVFTPLSFGREDAAGVGG